MWAACCCRRSDTPVLDSLPTNPMTLDFVVTAFFSVSLPFGRTESCSLEHGGILAFICRSRSKQRPNNSCTGNSNITSTSYTTSTNSAFQCKRRRWFTLECPQQHIFPRPQHGLRRCCPRCKLAVWSIAVISHVLCCVRCERTGRGRVMERGHRGRTRGWRRKTWFQNSKGKKPGAAACLTCQSDRAKAFSGQLAECWLLVEAVSN